MSKVISTRVWENLILEGRIEYGYAARRNRGSYSGEKVHRLFCEYIIGFEKEPESTKPGHADHRFAMARKADPNASVLFICRPCCGCTQGQNAGRPVQELTADNVTCTKCQKRVAK